MTRKETVRNLLTELIDIIDSGSQRDLDRADEIGTSIIKLFEQEPEWITIKTRPLTDKEKEEYADLGYSEDSIPFMYDCPLPEDGEKVLITTRHDEVQIDTFYRDEGCYFETYCEEDDVKAWMPKPKPYEPQESEDNK